MLVGGPSLSETEPPDAQADDHPLYPIRRDRERAYL